MNAALIVAGWLLPGGGYLLLRRYGRFAVFFSLVAIASLAGVMLGGSNLWPGADQLQGLDGMAALLARGGALAKALAGGPYLAARAAGYAQTYLAGSVHEYGTALLAVAGLLNLMAIAGAWELRQSEEQA